MHNFSDMSKFSIRKRIQSFKFAFNGIGRMLKNEHNTWIHLFATVAVIGAGIWFNLSMPEWICITFAIGLVFIAEGFNTAIEHLANAITLEKNELIKKAKDIAAGSVLIAALVSVIIGLIIFIPHIVKLFQ